MPESRVYPFQKNGYKMALGREMEKFIIQLHDNIQDNKDEVFHVQIICGVFILTRGGVNKTIDHKLFID